jgi:aconitate hydratase
VRSTVTRRPLSGQQLAQHERQEVTVLLRIDTPIEVDYYKHGGILPFVLRQLLAA